MQLRREAEALLAERKAEELSKKTGPVAKGARDRSHHDGTTVLEKLPSRHFLLILFCLIPIFAVAFATKSWPKSGAMV